MLARLVLGTVTAGAMIAPALAGMMTADEARRFVAGKVFAFTCFDGTRGAGRVLDDMGAAGAVQFSGAGPVRRGPRLRRASRRRGSRSPRSSRSNPSRRKASARRNYAVRPSDCSAGLGPLPQPQRATFTCRPQAARRPLRRIHTDSRFYV